MEKKTSPHSKTLAWQQNLKTLNPNSSSFTPLFSSMQKSHAYTNFPSYYNRYEEFDHAAPPVCQFFLKNQCRYGEKCYFAHPQEEKRLLDQECSICFEKIRDKNDLFGFLPNCNHIFCLRCIREWREKAKETNGKLCPCCRTLSYYVISSRRLFSNPDEKEEIHKEYLEKVAKIPCKLFKNGEGKCVFGTKCLYGHFDKEGKEVPKFDIPRKKKVQENARIAGIVDLLLMRQILLERGSNQGDSDEEEDSPDHLFSFGFGQDDGEWVDLHLESSDEDSVLNRSDSLDSS